MWLSSSLPMPTNPLSETSLRMTRFSNPAPSVQSMSQATTVSTPPSSVSTWPVSSTLNSSSPKPPFSVSAGSIVPGSSLKPLPQSVSLPAPPSSRSAPELPCIQSLPPMPLIVSLPEVPISVSSPAVPLIVELGALPPSTMMSVAASVAPLCSVAMTTAPPEPLPSAS
jgi:hypothetical protein